MKTRTWFAILAAAVSPSVFGLKPPSAADGPIKLLGCVVQSNGMLQAQVENQAGHAMFCALSCRYELGENLFSQTFEVSIPKHFQGNVGEFDTHGGKAGRYSGDIVKCRKGS